MGKTLAEILPLALAATVSPSGLLFVMLILSGPRNARRHALSFTLGGTFFLIVLAAVIGATYHAASQQASHPGTLSGVLDIVFALLIFATVLPKLLTRNRPKKRKKKKEKKQNRPYPLLGFLYMLINVSSLIPYIAAVKIIVDGASLPGSLLLYAVLIIITMFMIAFPVSLSYLVPEKSQKVMGPVTRFMQRHGSLIAQVYFLIMGVYLAVHGIIRIVSG